MDTGEGSRGGRGAGLCSGHSVLGEKNQRSLFSPAALLFNLLEEEGLVVGVPLQIYLRNSNDFSRRRLLYGFNFSLYINK